MGSLGDELVKQAIEKYFKMRVLNGDYDANKSFWDGFLDQAKKAEAGLKRE